MTTPAAKERYRVRSEIVQYLRDNLRDDGTVDPDAMNAMADKNNYSIATIRLFAVEAELPFRPAGNTKGGAVEKSLTVLMHWMQGKSLAESGREADVSREYARTVVDRAREMGFLDVCKKWKGE